MFNIIISFTSVPIMLVKLLYAILVSFFTLCRTTQPFILTSIGCGHETVFPSTRSSAISTEFDEEYILAKQAAVPPVQIVSSMPEFLPTDLHNRYYLLRHGQSTANVASIISSDRFSLAYSDKHGLTETGYQQGRDAAHALFELLRESSKPGDRLVFVSSPFARARQTAYACREAVLSSPSFSTLGLVVHDQPPVLLHDNLVERYFGRLDNEAIYTYAYVWPLDKFNTTHTAFDVESVAAVCTRFRELILDLEAQYAANTSQTSSSCHIVLVSHADVLQIAQLYAAHANNVGEFSSFRFKSTFFSACFFNVCFQHPIDHACHVCLTIILITMICVSWIRWRSSGDESCLHLFVARSSTFDAAGTWDAKKLITTS
jgi:probable phosphoglycerate mutase